MSLPLWALLHLSLFLFLCIHYVTFFSLDIEIDEDCISHFELRELSFGPLYLEVVDRIKGCNTISVNGPLYTRLIEMHTCSRPILSSRCKIVRLGSIPSLIEPKDKQSVQR